MTSTVGSEPQRYGLYVGNEFHAPAHGSTRDSISPTTGETWAIVAEANGGDVDAAVRTAREALSGPWGDLFPVQRGDMLRRLADLVERAAERLAEIEVRDNGKTIREMTGQYKIIPAWYRYFASLADKVDGKTLPRERAGMFAYTVVEPVGVVGAITPWNSPGLQLAFKAAPALAGGNTLVVKPSEYTPIATLEHAGLFEEAGFPPGVVNVVTGGAEAGAALAGHHGVDLIVFTGSDVTGRKVGAAAGEALSDVILELGGKSPQLVFADCDMDQAAIGVAAGVFSGTGQTCIAGSRVYVEEPIVEEFTARVVEIAKRLHLGNPIEWETEVGPVCFERHLERVLGFMDSAAAEGAEVLAGGERATEGELAEGFFFEPTVLGGVRQDMRVMREEIFGPVMGIQTFSDEDQLVALANDTHLGLAAGIWSTNLLRTHRLVPRLEAGTVWVNNYRLSSPQTPLTGFKDSGVGFENSQNTLNQFTRQKAVWLDYSGQAKDPFRL